MQKFYKAEEFRMVDFPENTSRFSFLLLIKKKTHKNHSNFSLIFLNGGTMNCFWSISGSLFSVAAPLQVDHLGTPALLKKSGEEKLLSVLWEMRRPHLLIHIEQQKKVSILIHLALIELWCDFWHTDATLCNFDAETTYWSPKSWSAWLDGEIVLKGDYN